MDLKDIQELIKQIAESNLTTLELEKEGFKLILKKETSPVGYGDGAGEQQIGQQGQQAGQGRLTAQEQTTTQTINAPIVGTFYAAPAPGEKPFVLPGSRVEAGDTLCIIEAMKLMNEIEAEEELLIIDVLVQDGQMVEYGQPLFAVGKP